MRVVALKAWSNGSIAMEERQVKELPDALAAQLIAQGIVAPTALPEITDADDGKVLTANSGVWGAQEPSGGALYVEVDNDYNTSHSATEIKSAVDNGKTVVAVYNGNTYQYSKFDSQNNEAVFLGYVGSTLKPIVIDNNKTMWDVATTNYGGMYYYLATSYKTLTFATSTTGTVSSTVSQIESVVRGGGNVAFVWSENGKNSFGMLTSVKYVTGFTYPRIEADFGDYTLVMYESNSSTNQFSMIPKGDFIVTLTPTALDYSGTMDKTVAEINAAYEAGREIWFKIDVGSAWTVYPLSRVGKISDIAYPSFNCNALYDEDDVLVMIYTGTTNDGTRQTYSTKIYAFTPAT